MISQAISAYTKAMTNERQMLLMARLQGLRHARAIFAANLEAIDKDIAAVEKDLGLPSAASESSAQSSFIPVSGPGKRGPDKKRRRITPEVRAQRIQALIEARARLAELREEERKKQSGERKEGKKENEPESETALMLGAGV